MLDETHLFVLLSFFVVGRCAVCLRSDSLTGPWFSIGGGCLACLSAAGQTSNLAHPTPQEAYALAIYRYITQRNL